MYGKEFQNRVATCSFHYKQSLQRHAQRLAEDEVDAFYDLGCQLLDAVSPTLCEEAYGTLLQFVKASSNREKSLGHCMVGLVEQAQVQLGESLQTGTLYTQLQPE